MSASVSLDGAAADLKAAGNAHFGAGRMDEAL